MLITLYTTQIGNVYQKFDINENDITYGDLIKYINLPKHKLFDELDLSKKIWNKVFIKTIINLFSYENNENNENSGKINLDDEIILNSNEFTIVFSYEYYIYDYYNYDYNYEKIKNNIGNYNNIYDALKNDPYQIIFIDSENENYGEICKLVVHYNSYVLQCINPELRTEEI